MPKILPEEDSPEFNAFIEAVTTLPNDRLSQFAKHKGFASCDSLLSQMRKRGVLRSKLYKSPTVQSAETITEDVSKQQAAAESAYYKKLYHEATKRIGMQDMIEKTMREMVASIPPVIVQTSSRLTEIITKKGTETDVAQCSDLHGGEVVFADRTLGMCQYNMQILNRRLAMMFSKIVELVNIRRSALLIPNLLIAQEGDMVSGEIHDELIRTNVAHMMTISVRVAFLMSQGIALLSPHFDHIDVHCVVGNHPRFWHKPSYKERYINWDYMVYQWEAAFCRSLKNVIFDIPKAPFILTKAENTRLLLMHGDDIRSWMGIPWYGIDRAIYRMRELLQGANKFFDSVLLGHFHNRADIEHVTGPVVINGSVKGGDEFSIGSMQTMNKPSQNLLFYHSKHGYIGGNPIYLEEADNRKELAFQDFLPDTWAELEDEVEKKRKVTITV